MDTHVTMSLFKTIVFSNVMKIVPANDNGTLHLQFLYNSGQDTSTNGDITSEWTFFVNVCTFNGLKTKEKKNNNLINSSSKKIKTHLFNLIDSQSTINCLQGFLQKTVEYHHLKIKKNTNKYKNNNGKIFLNEKKGILMIFVGDKEKNKMPIYLTWSLESKTDITDVTSGFR